MIILFDDEYPLLEALTHRSKQRHNEELTMRSQFAKINIHFSDRAINVPIKQQNHAKELNWQTLLPSNFIASVHPPPPQPGMLLMKQ